MANNPQVQAKLDLWGITMLRIAYVTGLINEVETAVVATD